MYKLLPPHPLAETHVIHLSTTHYLPTLAGKPPPLFSAKASRKEQSDFNWYYCALLMPWRWHETGTTHCSIPTWGQFRQLLNEDSQKMPAQERCDVDLVMTEPLAEQEQLKENTDLAKPVTPAFLQLLAQGRLLRFQNITTSLVVNKQVTNLIQAWRGRNRTLWNDESNDQDSAKRTALASRNFGDLDPALQQTITELLENSARATDASALQRAADLQKYAENCLNVLSDLQSHDVLPNREVQSRLFW